MSDQYARAITNSFQDVRLVSLASWSKASEIIPRDQNGPYVVTQEGCDPTDMTMCPDEFILGRSGKWLSLAYFYKLPIPERRLEFVFGTAGEVMKVLADLPGKVTVFRPGDVATGSPEDAAPDELSAVIGAKTGKG